MWLLKRLLQIRISTCVFIVLCYEAIKNLRKLPKSNYGHIPRGALEHELHKEVVPSLDVKETLLDCTYDDILQSNESIHNWQVPTKYDDFSAAGISNGSFTPEHCNPLVSVAILVVYRNRPGHLYIFLHYMHNFLRKQNIHYKIFLIDQQDNKYFNRGLLFNIGARAAIAEQFPCLILHDVDLLPLDAANLYACLRQPRHMSASIDRHRFVLVYESYAGGVLAIRANQFQLQNGFSNRFEKWGGEDDDLYNRMEAHGLKLFRFPPDMSRYTMLYHTPQEVNEDRRRIIAENKLRPGGEGLDCVSYESLRLVPQQLVTQLAVRL